MWDSIFYTLSLFCLVGYIFNLVIIIKNAKECKRMRKELQYNKEIAYEIAKWVGRKGLYDEYRDFLKNKQIALLIKDRVNK